MGPISVGVNIARTILGVIGNVISFGLFLSPVPTILRFYKKKSTEEFHPTNYLAGIMNCCLWIMYGAPAIHPHSTLIWTINAVGLVLYVVYIGAFSFYSFSTNRKMCYISGIGIIVIGIACAAISVPTLQFVQQTNTRTDIVGTIAVVFNIILYASPLSVVYKVFKTKSVEFLPFWVSLAGFLNGSCWTAYGFLPVDRNLLIGNGLGAVLSLFQLILHCIWGHPGKDFCFPFKKIKEICCGGGGPKKGGDQPEKAVQLENVVVA